MHAFHWMKLLAELAEHAQLIIFPNRLKKSGYMKT
jgi:hypothetical protein